MPIRPARYRDNWDLSTARAVAVVDELIAAGVAPNRLAAAGFGAFDPIADNRTEVGREQNRRSEIVLMPHLADIPSIRSAIDEMLTAKPTETEAP